MTRELPITKFPVVVPGVGPVPAPGMIIGEAPGRKEIEQGKPFVGRSGTLLDEALVRAGATRERFYITNVYKGDVGSGNRNPTEDEIRDHRHYLRAELEAVRPSGVLLLGRVAVLSFLPDIERLGDHVTRRYSIGGIHYYPCWHPAYCLRNKSALSDFKYTVMKFVLVTGVLDAHSR